MGDRGPGWEEAGRLSVVDGGRGRPPAAPLPPRVVLPPDWLPAILFAGDALIAGLSILAGYWLRTVDYADAATRLEQVGPYVHALPVVVPVCAVTLAVNRQYRSWRGVSVLDQLFRLYGGIGLAVLVVLSLLAVTHSVATYSRFSILFTAVICAAAMTGERLLLRELETRLRRRGIGSERVLVVGAGGSSELLIGRMTMLPHFGYTVCGVVDDGWRPGSTFAGLPVVGHPRDLARLVQDLHVDKCLLSIASDRRDRLVELMQQCEDQRIEYRLVPDLLDLMSTRASAESVDGLPLIGRRHRRIGSPAWAGKRLLDVAFACSALAILAPLLLAIAAAIRLTSPGAPALSGYERIGRFRRRFRLYRFRTIAPDTTAASDDVIRLWDPALTPLGVLLRRTGLADLPQLLNVLKGDMSIVGPRPQPMLLDERHCADVPRYLERQQVRPGLIGWAEANDVSHLAPIADRTMYDIYYIENWSLGMDLRVMVLTAIRSLRHRQAN